jgi:hypothetical protein
MGKERVVGGDGGAGLGVENLFDYLDGENGLIDLVYHFLNKFDSEGFSGGQSLWAKIQISMLAKKFLGELSELGEVYRNAFDSWKGLVNAQTLGGGNARFRDLESEEQKCLKKILILGMFQVHDEKNLAINLALRENLDKYGLMLQEHYRSGLADFKKSKDKDKVGDSKVADRQVIEESLNFREQGPANH